MTRRRVIRLFAGLAAAALLLGAPVVAQAHAELVLASPEPGMAQAPAAVVIKFSEPL